MKAAVIIAAFVAAAAWAFAPLAFADADGAAPAADDAAPPPDIAPGLLKELKALDAKLAKVKDLRGRFTQKKHTALLKEPLVSTGSLAVKGEQMRWDVVKPAPSTTLTSPTEIRIHYPKHKTVEVYAIDQRLSPTLSSPLPRLGPLLKQFKIERSPEQGAAVAKDEEGPPPLAIRLTPRKPELAEHLERVEVVIDRDSGLCISLAMVDADGDRTVITFADLKPNTDVKAEEMALKLPAGTRVVRPLEAVEQERK